jgi:hypothetical protein
MLGCGSLRTDLFFHYFPELVHCADAERAKVSAKREVHQRSVDVEEDSVAFKTSFPASCKKCRLLATEM